MTHAIDMSLQIVQTGDDDAFRQSRPGVVQRELGLDAASGGLFKARRVRVTGDWLAQASALDPSAWYTLVYILEGFVTVQLDGRNVSLCQFDAASQVPLTSDNVVALSPTLEFFELTAPDDARVRALIPDRPTRTLAPDAPELHVRGTGPRDFFDYRDLGVAAITHRQLEVQVIRARRAREGGTGWHSHTMAQLSYGLSGWASLGVEGLDQPVIQAPGDSLCIPPDCVHNADSFSSDYGALQLQIPADYDTTPRSDPRRVAA